MTRTSLKAQIDAIQTIMERQEHLTPEAHNTLQHIIQQAGTPALQLMIRANIRWCAAAATQELSHRTRQGASS